MAAVRRPFSLKVDLPGRLLPGEEIRADMNSLHDADYSATLAGVSTPVWLTEGPPTDRPDLWRLRTIRAWYQARLAAS